MGVKFTCDGCHKEMFASINWRTRTDCIDEILKTCLCIECELGAQTEPEAR